METNDELAQQGLTIVSGDKIPQQAGFNPLYLHAIIGPNNESGIMWREQVLQSLNYSDTREIAQDVPKRCVKWKECRPTLHVPPLATLQEVGAVDGLSYDAVTAELGNRIREQLTLRPEKSSRHIRIGTMDLVYSRRGFVIETVVQPMRAVARGRDQRLPFLPRRCCAKRSDEVALLSHSASGAQGGLPGPIRLHRRSRGKGADNVNAGGLIAWGRLFRRRSRHYQWTMMSDRAVK